MKGKEKNPRNKPARAPQASPGDVAGRASLKRRLILGCVLLLAGGGTWAFLEFVVWNKIPAELVGKWVVMKGPDEGGTIDFYRGGTMVAKVNQGGYEGIINARIKVQDKKIHVTTKNQRTGEEGTRVQSILLLDKTRLVLQDERGTSINLERAD